MKFIFIHTQRSAGTWFFQQVLQNGYGEAKIFEGLHENMFEDDCLFNLDKDAWNSRRLKEVKKFDPSGYIGLRVHAPVTKFEGFFPEAKRFMLMRDPVKRLFSHHAFMDLHKQRYSPEGEISDQKIYEVYNQTLEEMIRNPLFQNVYSRYIDGRLDLLDLIFTPDSFESDFDFFRELIGYEWNVKSEYRNLDATAKYDELFEEKSDLVEEMRELNKEDIELFKKISKGKGM